MWIHFSVHFQPRTIKTPKKIWFFFKERRIGAFIKIKLILVRRIMVPESLITSEIWKTWIFSDSSPTTDQNIVCIFYELSSLFNVILDHLILIIKIKNLRDLKTNKSSIFSFSSKRIRRSSEFSFGLCFFYLWFLQ